MKLLNYQTLKDISYQGYVLEKAPERVLQFGEGNFLRAFAEYFIDVANEKAAFDGKVVVVQPISQGALEQSFAKQQGLYTLYLRGYENGRTVEEKRVISAISRYINPYTAFDDYLKTAENPDLRYIVSNTTEAGIAYDGSCQYEDMPPAGFPAKLARLLHQRWKVFGGAPGNGLIILSCELIDNNGQILRECVQRHIEDWGLEPEFMGWVENQCLFCSTLVDRIVTGCPGKEEAERLNMENCYEDTLMDTGEVFGLWVIEGPRWLEKELPLMKAGLPVKIVEDHSPYKKQKVRILNGAHTCMVCAAYLCGQDIVRDSMKDDDIGSFVKKAVYHEILPSLGLTNAVPEEFAQSVFDRFQNPFIDHKLLSIALNTTSKWKARVLPSLKDYIKMFGSLPNCLTFSLASYIAFYTSCRLQNGKLVGKRFEQEYEVQDDAYILTFFTESTGETPERICKQTLSEARLWGEDLTGIHGLSEQVTAYLQAIQEKGMRAALRAMLKNSV